MTALSTQIVYGVKSNALSAYQIIYAYIKHSVI